MTLQEWYKTEADAICAEAASRVQREWIGFRLLDAITGENITNDIDPEEWDAVKVDAIETRPDFVAVYVSL